MVNILIELFVSHEKFLLIFCYYRYFSSRFNYISDFTNFFTSYHFYQPFILSVIFHILPNSPIFYLTCYFPYFTDFFTSHHFYQPFINLLPYLLFFIFYQSFTLPVIFHIFSILPIFYLTCYLSIWVYIYLGSMMGNNPSFSAVLCVGKHRCEGLQ